MLLDDLLSKERAGLIQLQPFSYSAVFPLAVFVAGAVIPINININNDSDFVWRYTMLTAMSAAGVPVVVPDYSIQFFDTGSGRQFQDQPRHVLNCTGTAQLPYILPEPLRIAAASILVVTMTNIGGPAALAYVDLAGMKVFSLSGYVR